MREFNYLWACEEQFARQYFDCILNADSEDIKAALGLQSSSDSQILSVDGDEATISIKGVLTSGEIPPIAKFFGFNGTSYPEIKEALDTVAESPEVKKVKLAMDTPGGDVKGVDEVAQQVAELGKKKTIIAENQGMIASAGYWIASQAKQIVSTSPANETGSIGVLNIGYDLSEAKEKLGIKRVVIVSKNAPEKVTDVESKKSIQVLQKRVDGLEGVFISRVAEGRKVSEENVKKNFGQGGLLIANDASAVGMIDKVVKNNTSPAQDSVLAEINTSAFEARVDKIIENIEKEDSKKKGKSMATLKELIAENEGLKAEVDKIRSEAFGAGKTEAMEIVAKVTPFINGEYPDSIKTMATKVLSGEGTVDGLLGAAAYYDSTKEVVNDKAAVEETEEIGGIQVETPVPVSEDGTVNTEDDYQAAVKDFNSLQGNE
jgi:ClpP class serine protease